MKRFAIILVSALLVAAIAYPVFAWGPGMGRGQGMRGNWGAGPGSCVGYDREYGNLTQEQRSALSQLYEKFSNETAPLRNEIWTKSDELHNLLNAPDPDAEKAKALQKELLNLRSRMAEKRLDLHLETRKINPDVRFGAGYGKGYGRHMKGFGTRAGKGYHRHMRGYGLGPCWN